MRRKTFVTTWPCGSKRGGLIIGATRELAMVLTEAGSYPITVLTANDNGLVYKLPESKKGNSKLSLVRNLSLGSQC